jgi:Na+-driven multidrug efflux pump
VYNSADTFFVSQINTSASAAVGVVFSLMALIHAIGLGIGIGTNSLVSRRLGAKRNDEAEMLVASGFLQRSLWAS